MTTKSALLCISFALVLSIVWQAPGAYAQSKTATGSFVQNSSGVVAGNNIVSVSASVSVQVSNETIKTKESMLRSAVVNFLTSGPNVLKTSETDLPNIKTKVVNQVNNDTQSIEGSEATNAIVGVEVSKALKTIVASTEKSAPIKSVTIQTSSTCKPSAVKSIACDNVVTIK